MGHLDVQHVTYSLPDGRILLLDVSFRVGEGAVTALIGANGAGKSTTMRIIGATSASMISRTRSGWRDPPTNAA